MRPREHTVPTDLRSTAGFSLIEALLASGLMLMLIGGAATMFGSMRDNYTDTSQKIDAQQAARIAMVQIQRDLQIAGVGLARLQPPFPVVIPRIDGGVDMRVNQGLTTTFLVSTMIDVSDALDVADVTGFVVGQTIAVYDAAGSIGLTTISAINAVANQISHDGLNKAYDTADGPAVALVDTITYRLVDAGDGTFDLVRELNGGGTATLAARVNSLTFRYFDASTPPVQFNPTTTAQQLLIRMIGADLEVAAESARIVTGDTPTVTLSGRVAPRSLALF